MLFAILCLAAVPWHQVWAELWGIIYSKHFALFPYLTQVQNEKGETAGAGSFVCFRFIFFFFLSLQVFLPALTCMFPFASLEPYIHPLGTGVTDGISCHVGAGNGT